MESTPRFKVGEQVYYPARAQTGMVRGVNSSGEEAWYEVFFGEGQVLRIPEHQLERAGDLLDCLIRGDMVDPLEFDLHSLALSLTIAHSGDPHASLSNSRLEPMPHQVFITHKAVNSGLYPRMLLADDVGLGKTIEAGMIFKELKARGLVKRTLILTPASLVNQWLNEMERKFNERFHRYDSSAERYLRQEGSNGNIWTREDQVITSLQFARDDSRRQEIAAAGWDLVIIDEAHHARRRWETSSTFHQTKAYLLARELRDRTKGLLLLTATPLQLEPFEFYSLIELLDPGAFRSYEDFKAYYDARREDNSLVSRVQEYHTLAPHEQEQILEQLLTRPSLQSYGLDGLRQQMLSEEGRERVVSLLAERDKLTGLMVRNRKRVIGGFTKRVANTLTVDMTPEELEVYREMSDYISQGYKRSVSAGDQTLGFVMVVFQKLLTSSPRALASALQRRSERLSREVEDLNLFKERLAEDAEEGLGIDEDYECVHRAIIGYTREDDIDQEREALSDLLDKVRSLRVDSKLNTLRRLLGELLSQADQKVLIFTQFKDTLRYLQEQLSKDYPIAVFHGDMDATEKDRAVQRFRGEARIMVSTEAGGEGRNFQFCNCLVNYDLPWNPMRVEQRIGRLDRIGQTKNVHIYNFALSGTIEARVLAVLENRIRLFTEYVGGLEPILGNVEQDLIRILMAGPNAEEEIQRYEVSLEDKIRRAQEAENKMADFLMDRASYRKDTYNEIQGRTPSYTHLDIEQFLELYFGRSYRGHLERLSDNLLRIRPPVAWSHRWPRLYERALFEGTCNPKKALQDDCMDFFAFGHPVFDAAVQDVLGGNLTRRRSMVTSRICQGTPMPGRRFLQCNVVLELLGVRTFKRFVPICVDLDTGEYDPGTSAFLARCPSEPFRGPVLEPIEADLMRKAWEQVTLIAQEATQDFMDSVQQTNLRLYRLEKERTERRSEWELAELEKELGLQEAILEALAGGTEQQKRIIPVYRQKVAELKEKIAAGKTQRDGRLSELERLRLLSPSFRIESASLVSTV